MLGKISTDAAAERRVPTPRRSTLERRQRQQNRRFSRQLGRLALRCLHDELMLYPKPGLVSSVDSGSHDDMDATTFMRSLFAVRHYFVRITEAGQQRAAFPVLKQFGIDAEARMLAATGGVNTHRGAIFTLGLLCAALGYCQASQIVLLPHAIRAALLIQWGDALSEHARDTAANSHGARVASAFGIGGVREEAALGFPAVFDIGLPALQQALDAGRDSRCAQIDALMALMANVADTTVYHRGGEEGAALVRTEARLFLDRGATAQTRRKEQLLHMHQKFIAHRLSPGGSADLLAASLLVQRATGITVG